MRKQLAKALWILAVAGLPLAGCATSSDNKGNAAHQDQPIVVASNNAVEDMAPEPGAVDGEAKEEKPSSVASEMGAVGKTVARKKNGRTGRMMARPRPTMTTMPAKPPMKIPGPAPTDPSTVGNSEDYKNYGVNPMVDTSKDRLSTFAIDVDTASYAIARRKILSGKMPPPAAVRVEEFVNYFKYDYASPTDGSPFAVHMDAAPSPFHKGRHILRVGVKAKDVSIRDRKPANLVFLVDVSGSMGSQDKLPLAKRALRVLVDNLKDGDTVSLVTYAGNTRVVLPPTDVAHKAQIVSALEDLNSGGSTAMSSGLELAYELAAKNLAPGTVSRVLVLSDGDANIGNTSHDRILASIQGKVKEGVTMSTIGFGMGNYKDSLMEQLANKGNGNYYYIDSFSQAKRVFQEQSGGTLEVVAKDVKIQVEMDPSIIKSYRLVGYENRDIADADFRNDKVDAGEIGAGHSVTAIYEVELAKSLPANLGKLATVRIRHKAPRGTKASEKSYSFSAKTMAASFEKASRDLRFATAVMAAAEVLRESPHAKDWRIARIKSIAAAAADTNQAERSEFLTLLDKIAPLHKLAAR